MRSFWYFAHALTLCSLVAARTGAQATDEAWLIVPSTSALTEGWMEPTMVGVRTELLQRGVAVWPARSAAAKFEQNASADPAMLTGDQIEAWTSLSRAALWHLAQGEPRAALEQLSEAQSLSRRAIEAVSRDEERAKRVLDTCLYMVRALLETGLATDANALGRECRVLVPQGEPSVGMHPSSVLKVFRAADAERVERPSTLRVTSNPSGCAVRLNGLQLGNTPFEKQDLLPAQYRVQVECDPAKRGRVHVVDTISGLGHVFVNPRFDRAVRTDPFLHLGYDSTAQENAHRVADAEAIGEAVHASALVLLRAPTPNALELELFEGTPLQQRALVRVPAGAEGLSRGDAALAVRTILAGKCTDFTVIPSAPLPCKVEPKGPAPGQPSTGRRPRGQLISGLTLVGAGGASLVTGYALLGPRARAAEDWIAQLDSTLPPDGKAQQQWLDMGTAIMLTSSIGAAALVTAMPLSLPNRAKPPWWAWLSGGLGVGFAAFSIAYGVTGQDKPPIACASLNISSADAQACVRHGERVSGAVLAGVTAAPLITVPLVYLFRPGGARLEPSVQLSPRGGFFSIRGRL
jgi:hypothetical protein